MDYNKIFHDNKTILTSDIVPFLKKIYTNKRACLISVITAILAVIFTIIYMIVEKDIQADKILLARESMINSEITKLENENDILEAEVLLLKEDVKSLSRKKDKKKLEKISKYLSDTELHGHGVEIIVDDNNSDTTLPHDSTAIIHNTDLLRIVNFLWEENALGVSVNNIRITPNSYISCIGATILINQKRITPPFKIYAVGKNLSKNMVLNSSVMLSLKLRGIEVEVAEKSSLILPAGKYSSFKE